MTDLNELMQQAQEIQRKLKEAEQELAKLEVDGESGGGLVKVTVNGRHDVRSVKLDDSLMKEDKEVVEDLIAAAFNDASRKLSVEHKDKMESVTGGLKLPEGLRFS